MAVIKIPTDYVNVSERGVTIAKAWVANHSTFITPFVTQANFLLHHETMITKLQENKSIDGQQSSLTLKLKTSKKKLKDSVKFLKATILEEAGDKNIAESWYINYGLRKVNSSIWSFSTDNDTAKQQIDILITKLSEPNNPIANRKFGLAYFTDLRDEFVTAWDTSKALKSQKTVISQECIALKTQAILYQRDLKKMIEMSFRGQNINKVLREFGFLSETAS
jgi:hypothetical protein